MVQPRRGTDGCVGALTVRATLNREKTCTEDSHYDTVGVALLWTLEQGLGETFTREVEEAWTAVYDVLATTMKAAASEGMEMSE